MASTQRDDILRAVRKREAAEWKERHPDEVNGEPQRRKEVKMQEMIDFVCGICYLTPPYVPSSD